MDFLDNTTPVCVCFTMVIPVFYNSGKIAGMGMVIHIKLGGIIVMIIFDSKPEQTSL